MNPVFANTPTTIFEEMSTLARAHDAVNLGQGFPDGDEPRLILDAAADALTRHPNQYPPMRGLLELRHAVAEHDKRFHGLDIDPEREVLVTSGATEALAACFLGLLEAGDEVIVFDPAYDSYVPMIRRAGGVARVVAMRPPSWTFDVDELRRAFTEKTKLVVVNTPMNPTGRVLTRDELTAIANLALEHRAYVVSDEVYEHIVFAPHRHVSMLGMPGMRDRAIKIGSAGKTFSVTGFKVGYITAAPELTRVIAAALAQLGMPTTPCEGTYFLLAQVGADDDRAYCLELTRRARVTAIPVSALCSEHKVSGFVRFCFAKRHSLLDEALARLATAAMSPQPTPG